MAKRKRLTPARTGYLADTDAPAPRASLGAPPIAQVAGEAAATAALEEVSAELAAARAEGRMIEALPLEAIDETYLIRDRVLMDPEDMESLKSSLRARGQQTAIEVVAFEAPRGTKAYGLVSGWRRLMALRALQSETGERRFAKVRALIARPQAAQDAYVAMVEENEIRVNLSFYERARIALQSVQAGVFPDRRAALQGLFGAATRSRRSKIGSFIGLVEALDDDLHHPAQISEKLGLDLARHLAQTEGFAAACGTALRQAPDRTAAEEMEILRACVADAASAPRAAPKPRSKPQVLPVVGDMTVTYRPDTQRIEIGGAGVDDALARALQAWLASQVDASR